MLLQPAVDFTFKVLEDNNRKLVAKFNFLNEVKLLAS
jgi:hypothetical protein